jgi:CHAD domain-containing protein
MENDEDAAGLSVSAVAVAPVRLEELEELARERVRRFMKLLPEVLNSASPESVHDLRVWSRRLQQALVTMLPKTKEHRGGAVIRSVRQARRALSGWRDCDVLIGLLDSRLRRLRDADEQRAWQIVRDYIAMKRQREISAAQRRLARRRLFTLAQRTDHLLKDREPLLEGLEPSVSLDTAEPNVDPIAIVAKFINVTCSAWHATLTRAAESNDLADAHNLRIKTKKLRYWVELARDLGDKDLLIPLNRLRWLQDRLGEWHDRAELVRIATEAIARTDFPIVAPRPTSLLFRRLARELTSGAAKVKSLLAIAKTSGEVSQLDDWVTSHSARIDNAEI